jgi:N-acetylmuramoyl-L-alanine amidase
MKQAWHLRVATAAGLLAGALATAMPAPAQSLPPSKKVLVQTYLTRADKMRAGLEGEPPRERTEREYSSVVEAYRRAIHAAPASTQAQTALVAVAELYHEMGRAYNEDYFQKAIETYEFLLKEFPAARARSQALFTIGQIQLEDLDHPDEAEKTFDEFLAKYPHSPKAADAQEELKQIAAEREHAAASRSAGAAGGAASQKAAAEERARARRMPQVTGIREWNAENYTRVVISLEDEVKYQAARIANPDRIYFDLYTARLSSALSGKTLDVQNGFLKAVRVAQNQAGVVRVVLEVEKVKDYSVFLLRDPYRLVVDVYGDANTAKAATPAGTQADKASATGTTTAKNQGAPAGKNTGAGAEQARDPFSGQRGAAASIASGGPAREGAKSGDAAATTQSAKNSGAKAPAFVGPPSPAGSQNAGEVSAEKSGGKANATPVDAAESQPGPDEQPGAAAESPAAPAKSSSRAPADAGGAGTVPQATRRGEHSLTRTLGLKIGKIVIDPGHGGHDTGTIGPNGLEEKDLTLDVALRLGKLIEQKLGAQVVYTRTDDTFVPLEERTALANQAKGDLFISIHANSSSDSSARGIETYYLNLTDSEEAREVAARENALAQASYHDLQDLVQKITRNEKIDESRELAGDIQSALAKRMQRTSHAQRNRGVKRAPFIVLLGANMPSVLTEISFISNPTDEALLKKGEQRQKVAEGILAGITHYLENLGSVSRTTATLVFRPAELADR